MDPEPLSNGGVGEALPRLNPIGYKIGLELIVKCGCRNVREVPIHFAQRHAGQSKLTVKEQFRYLEHLSRLYDYTFPRASPIVKSKSAATTYVSGRISRGK